MKATFGDNSDVTQVYTTVSLHCPLSLSFIKIPVKDTKCNHIQVCCLRERAMPHMAQCG